MIGMRKTLPNTFSTIPDFPSHIDRNQESWHLGDFNQDSISSHHLELDQYQTIDKLGSFHLNEIELEQNCEFKLSFRDSIPKSESMLPSVSLPKLDHIPKPTSILVPTILKLNNLFLIITFDWWEKNINLNSLIWTQLLNQNWLLKLNLI